MLKMNNYSITVVNNNLAEIVEFSLDDNDLNLCKLYVSNYERLQQASIVKDGFLSKLKIEIKGSNISVCSKIPNDDAISVFLHRLRAFILEREPASFIAVARIIGKNIKNETVRSMIKETRQSYQAKYVENTIQICSNNTPLFSESMLNKWINAYEYHQDQEKRIEVEKLYKNIGGLQTANAVNLMLLAEKLKSISRLADLLNILFVKKHVFETKA